MPGGRLHLSHTQQSILHLLHSHGPTEVGRNLLIYFVAVTNKEKDTTDADNFTINSNLSAHGYNTVLHWQHRQDLQQDLEECSCQCPKCLSRDINPVLINTNNFRAGGHTSTVQEEEEYQGQHFWPNSNLATVGVIPLVNQYKFYSSQPPKFCSLSKAACNQKNFEYK